MNINEHMSLKGCWRMVNAIQNAKTAKEIRERCAITEQWLTANKRISTSEYNDLMMAVSYIHRESYH